MNKKTQHIRLLRIGGIFLFVLLLLIFLVTFCYYYMVHGRTFTTTDIQDYSNYEKYERLNNLATFPDNKIESLSSEYFYQYCDSFGMPTVQIILTNIYTEEQFTKEIQRLENIELTYNGESNSLYKDDLHFITTAYVGMANWNDTYEYALIVENLNTITYVYLENISKTDLHINNILLPNYYNQQTENMNQSNEISVNHFSFYAFKLGETYINCTDLYQKYSD